MEQALVLISIVLGVAIAFELENLNRALRSKHVKWHWAQALFAIFALLLVVSFWWAIASQDLDRSVSLGAFLPIMGVLILLVLISAVALPDELPSDHVLDMGEYYQENRRYQWGLVAGFMMVAFGYDSWWSFARLEPLEAAVQIAPNAVVPLLCLTMMFLERWWKVAIGFAALYLLPLFWLSRTLG